MEENNPFSGKTIEELQKMKSVFERFRAKEEHKITPLRRKLIMNDNKEITYKEQLTNLNGNLRYLTTKIEFSEGIRKQQFIFKKSAVELSILKLSKKKAYFLKPADRLKLENDIAVSDEILHHLDVAIVQIEKRIGELNAGNIPVDKEEGHIE